MNESKIEEILSKYEELRVQKFIDLTTDFGFKRIFRNAEFMIDFLNDLFKAYRKNNFLYGIAVCTITPTSANFPTCRIFG